MKIIDLLNKIANGEEVPKKIKYKGSIYTYLEQEGNKIYQYEDYNAVLDIQCFEKLNDEIEIIEEEKKIPEKMENEHEFYSYAKYEENKNEIDKVLYILKAINLAEEKIGNLNNSVNEIIDYLQSKGDE